MEQTRGCRVIVVARHHVSANGAGGTHPVRLRNTQQQTATTAQDTRLADAGNRSTGLCKAEEERPPAAGIAGA
jgi:hypothetical protein